METYTENKPRLEQDFPNGLRHAGNYKLKKKSHPCHMVTFFIELPRIFLNCLNYLITIMLKNQKPILLCKQNFITSFDYIFVYIPYGKVHSPKKENK